MLKPFGIQQIMSEVRPVNAPIEKLGGKSEHRQRARFIRKPNAVPRFTKGKPFPLCSNMREVVFLQLALDMERLRYNIKYIAHKRGSNVAQLCRDLHSVGIKTSRDGIVRGNRRFSVQLQYITTMALALRVPTWLMIHPDIESIWDSLDLD